MKQKKLTRAEKEAQGLKKPTRSKFEIRKARKLEQSRDPQEV